LTGVPGVRFLADMGVSLSTVRHLREAGHDAVHLRDEGLGRLADSAILEKARHERRVVLTFDLDFADLMAFGDNRQPSVVVFRLHNQTPDSVTPKLMEVIRLRYRELEEGAFVVVEETRHRIRRLPLRHSEGS
jgi:predicted nuclease of predicted toxin-antitoxin system